jgi:hypothetical protein
VAYMPGASRGNSRRGNSKGAMLDQMRGSAPKDFTPRHATPRGVTSGGLGGGATAVGEAEAQFGGALMQSLQTLQLPRSVSCASTGMSPPPQIPPPQWAPRCEMLHEVFLLPVDDLAPRSEARSDGPLLTGLGGVARALQSPAATPLLFEPPHQVLSCLHQNRI